MKNAFGFATNVWMTAVILSPLIYCLYLENKIEETGGMLSASIPIMAFGEFYSIPSWLALGISAWLINGLSIEVDVKKILLSLLAVLFTWLPFTFFNFFEEEGLSAKGLMFVYMIVIVSSVWFYKLSPNLSTETKAHPHNSIP